MIRVELPAHLRTLAQVGREVELEVAGSPTLASVLDTLEAKYPMLRGTIRDQVTLGRRPFLRFFACKEDLSQEPSDAPLPEAVAAGEEPFLIVDGILQQQDGVTAIRAEQVQGLRGVDVDFDAHDFY